MISDIAIHDSSTYLNHYGFMRILKRSGYNQLYNWLRINNYQYRVKRIGILVNALNMDDPDRIDMRTDCTSPIFTEILDNIKLHNHTEIIDMVIQLDIL